MRRQPIKLGPEDPTIFVKCPRTYVGMGARIQDIYMAAFSPRKWKRGPVCPNCGKQLVKLYEVK